MDRLVLLLHRARQPPARRPSATRTRERGVGGESWEIHGGGFYRIEKFTVAPETLPEPLHWYKWEAYTTWLSGFALFVVLYYLNAVAVPRRPLGQRPLDRLADRDLARRCSSPRGSSTTCSAATLAATSRCSRAIVLGLVVAVGLGLVPAVLAARGLDPGRRDARDDHGGERLLRDHPGALAARAREGARRGARPAPQPPRQAAVGAQQLLHAAGRARDDLEPLRLRLRPHARLARARRADGARRARPPLLQPPPPRHRTSGGSPRVAALAVVAIAVAMRPDDTTSAAARRRPCRSRACSRSSTRAACPCHQEQPHSYGITSAAEWASGSTARSAIVALAQAIRTQAVDTHEMPIGNLTQHDRRGARRRSVRGSTRARNGSVPRC